MGRGPHSRGKSGNFEANLYGHGFFTRREVARLAREIQFEVLWSAVRLIRRPSQMNCGMKCGAPAC